MIASIDGGRGRLSLGFVDPLSVVVILFLVLGGRKIRVVDDVLVGAVRSGGLRRPFDPRDEVAEDLFGDLKAALELGVRFGRRLEEDDVVRALAVPIDLVGEAAAAPRGDLDDLPAPGAQLPGRAVDDRLGFVVSDVRSQDEHEFVSAHAPGHSFQWDLLR